MRSAFRTAAAAMAAAMAMAAARAGETAAAPELLLYAAFEGEMKPLAERAGAEYAEGVRGKALKRTGKEAGWSAGKIDARAGTLSVWVKRGAESGAPAVTDAWENRALTWGGGKVRAFRNGYETKAAAGLAEAVAAHTPFRVEGVELKFADGKWEAVDELRVYSAALGDRLAKELWRREQVVEIAAAGSFGTADCAGEVRVRAGSPAGCAFEELNWCICDAANRVMSAYERKLRGGWVKLTYNLPAGQYYVRATDGTWFYGMAPLTVLPDGNKWAKAEKLEKPEERAWAGNDPGRLWRDLFAGKRSENLTLNAEWRREAVWLKRIEAEDRGVRRRLEDGTYGPDAAAADRADRILAEVLNADGDVLALRGDASEFLEEGDWLGAWTARASRLGIEVAVMPEGKGAEAAARAVAERYAGSAGFCGVVRAGVGGGADAAFAAKMQKSFGGMRVYVAGGDGAEKFGENALAGRVVGAGGPAEALAAGDCAFLAMEMEGGAAKADAGAAEFLRDFRMLPRRKFGVEMKTAGGAEVRALDWNGKIWAYALNAGGSAQRLELDMPAGARNLKTNERYGGFFGGDETATLELKPRSMTAFVMGGRPPKAAGAK